VSEFRFIDLFAGVGGFHLAMDDLGGECVWASEIDVDAAKVYSQHFEMEPVGDIQKYTQAEGVDPAVAIPAHDVLCAGFPCQPFSKSGFQRGIGETRGTLFFDILRILETHRPQFAILENVRNLAGPRQRETWDTIIRQLRALGYRVAGEPVVFSPHLLPPELEGRPQVRDRVFILAEYVGEGAPEADLIGEVLVPHAPVDDWDPDRWRIEEYLDDDDAIDDVASYRLRDDEQRWLDAWQAFVQRIDDDYLPGFPIWVDAFTPEPIVPAGTPKWKRAFLEKNAQFYVTHRATIDQWLAEFAIAEFPASRRKFEWQARRHQPYAKDRDLFDLVIHMRPSGIRVKPPTYLPALVAITQTSIIGSRGRRITPREAARLQGFPEDFVVHPNDAAAYKQFGNAVNVGAVKHVARQLLDPEGRRA
jgi:DNA (cytosine-5)-methyltransferase 1